MTRQCKRIPEDLYQQAREIADSASIMNPLVM